MANKTTSSKSKPPSYKVSKEPFATDHYKSGFKQRDYQAEKKLATTEDKRPNSMKNRYFSIENIEKVNEENVASTPQTSSSALESNEFMQRRDYLIKKLLKSRTLPEPDKMDPIESDTIQVSAQADEPIKLFKPNREHAFQDEFIPLFGNNADKKRKKAESSDEDDVVEISDDSESSDDAKKAADVVKRNTDYKPHAKEIQNYQGPYSIKCLTRSRQMLIDEFMTNSTTANRSNYIDRRFEILKMKLSIKSKFDNDNRLWNKIRRETAQVRQIIYDRIERRDRRLSNYLDKSTKATPKNKHIVYENVSSDDDDELFAYDKTKSAYLNKNNKKFVESKQDDTTSDSDSSGQEDVINMINQQESELNDDDIKSSQDDDEDSKCKQFGKYSNSKKKQLKKEKKSTSSNLRRKAEKKSNDSVDTRMRIDRVGLVADDEYEQLKQNYKTIRNKRNKLLRKKKGAEIEAKRVTMTSELKVIRASMKKMRRKKKLNTGQYNHLDLIRNSDSKLPKSKRKIKRLKNPKHKNLVKTNRTF